MIAIVLLTLLLVLNVCHTNLMWHFLHTTFGFVIIIIIKFMRSITRLRSPPDWFTRWKRCIRLCYICFKSSSSELKCVSVLQEMCWLICSSNSAQRCKTSNTRFHCNVRCSFSFNIWSGESGVIVRNCFTVKKSLSLYKLFHYSKFWKSDLLSQYL